ncbi:MAG: hypothetical protein ACW981_03095 [Candidatus Hodarchaeales archaeon]|jgi:hypothetical protein
MRFRDYFIKKFLLAIPTIIGVSIIAYLFEFHFANQIKKSTFLIGGDNFQ